MSNPVVARLMAAMQAELRALTVAFAYLGRAEWERQAGRVIVERHAAAYFAGQGSTALSARADRELGLIYQRELAALAGFGDALEAGRLSPAQAQARATLYSGALKATHSRGETALWRLPFHPADGATACRTNCRCSWRIVVLDLEELDADAFYELGAAEHCADCKARAQRASPLRIRGGELM